MKKRFAMILAFVLILAGCSAKKTERASFSEVVPEFVAEDYDETGTCGEEIQWGFKNATGELIIMGEGKMEDYKKDDYGTYSTAPWNEFAYNIKSVEMYGVTSIGGYAFSFCDSLSSVEIPDSVTTIGEKAFLGCESLITVKIPDGVTTIKDSAFRRCLNLSSVEIPDSVTAIETDAFTDCVSLTSVKIPDSVTTLEKFGFSYCKNLVSIDLPSTVTDINESAFSGCDSLIDVYYSGTEEQWDAIEIGADNESLATATVHFNS